MSKLIFGCDHCINRAHEGQRIAKLLEQNQHERKKIIIEKVFTAQCPHCDTYADGVDLDIIHEENLIDEISIRINGRRFCKEEDCGKELYY